MRSSPVPSRSRRPSGSRSGREHGPGRAGVAAGGVSGGRPGRRRDAGGCAPGAAIAVRATAEALPFRDGAFDAALGVLTVHHWSDRDRGLAQMRRVTRGSGHG